MASTASHSTHTARPVVVIIGAGGMGSAAAQRLGSGRQLILADASTQVLAATAAYLTGNGYSVMTQQVDICDYNSVAKLATDAASAGYIEAVVHAAGLSPIMATASRIYAVDLVGTANVIDAFSRVVTTSSSMVCIASIAGHGVALPPEAEKHFAMAPMDTPLKCDAIAVDGDDTQKAYSVSKRANILRVQAAAGLYGHRGARINSISPGIIATPMGEKELAGPLGDFIRDAVARSATKRKGTAHDVADAIAFLTGPQSSFITGTDLVVDGGWTACSQWKA